MIGTVGLAHRDEIGAELAADARGQAAARACFLVVEHPVDRGAGVDRGGVVDREDVGADVDGKHQLGAAEDDRLDLLLGKVGDQGLQLALAVADDAAGAPVPR